MEQASVQIVQNRKVSQGHFCMRLACGELYRRAVPGQFVMLRLVGQKAPFLSRPFSIHRLIAPENGSLAIDILYRVVGGVTAKLRRLKTGQYVQILGPLGKGFEIPDSAKIHYLAAGGIGVAPLLFLAEKIKARRDDLSQSGVFIGTRTASELLCAADFKDLGFKVHISTEDGSAGRQCLVTEPLEAALATRKPDMLYACGPPGMLACIAGLAETHRLACQVSLETLMACGIGACLGCAVKGAAPGTPFQHVCKEGPVFDVRAVKLD